MYSFVLIQSKPLELVYAGLDPPSRPIQHNWCTLVSPRASEDPRQARPSVVLALLLLCRLSNYLFLGSLSTFYSISSLLPSFVCVSCIVVVRPNVTTYYSVHIRTRHNVDGRSEFSSLSFFLFFPSSMFLLSIRT